MFGYIFVVLWADFGLSNDFGGETVCGSPAYSSPEVLGAKNYGPEADIWSL